MTVKRTHPAITRCARYQTRRELVGVPTPEAGAVPRINQLLARQIAVGIGQKIGIFGGYVGPVEIIDQLVGLGDIPGIGGNREIVQAFSGPRSSRPRLS